MRMNMKWKVLTQGLNPGLLHCRQILYHLNHEGSPIPLEKGMATHSSILAWRIPARGGLGAGYQPQQQHPVVSNPLQPQER